ncbi:MAG: pseudaminic acid biosynthesis-associated methylase [Sulfurimonas sp.]|nr:pseudaminic acid biosynthesis-associated methylase [Sulfurimonas sp.]
MSFTTDQERFWAGEFGDEYIERNNDKWLIASNMALFSSVLKRTRGVKSLIEFGANIGMNLRPLSTLLPKAEISAIEINQKAVEKLNKVERLKSVYHESILDFKTDKKFDFVFTKGVLIHINPDLLDKVYASMYDCSSRYICMIEYYNPTPVEVSYRGHSEKLYKRDFAGEMMQKYPDLELVDYGFIYKNDPVFMQGDATWFLMQKR